MDTMGVQTGAIISTMAACSKIFIIQEWKLLYYPTEEYVSGLLAYIAGGRSRNPKGRQLCMAASDNLIGDQKEGEQGQNRTIQKIRGTKKITLAS